MVIIILKLSYEIQIAIFYILNKWNRDMALRESLNWYHKYKPHMVKLIDLKPYPPPPSLEQGEDIKGPLGRPVE